MLSARCEVKRTRSAVYGSGNSDGTGSVGVLVKKELC